MFIVILCKRSPDMGSPGLVWCWEDDRSFPCCRALTFPSDTHIVLPAQTPSKCTVWTAGCCCVSEHFINSAASALRCSCKVESPTVLRRTLSLCFLFGKWISLPVVFFPSIFQSFKYNCTEVNIFPDVWYILFQQNVSAPFQNISWLRVILFEARGCQKGRIMDHDLAVFICDLFYFRIFCLDWSHWWPWASENIFLNTNSVLFTVKVVWRASALGWYTIPYQRR